MRIQSNNVMIRHSNSVVSSNLPNIRAQIIAVELNITLTKLYFGTRVSLSG